MNLLLEDLVVLLLLVQHVLLLGLLQGSLIDLPPVQLPQLLTLLKGKQFIWAGCSQTHPSSDVTRCTSAQRSHSRKSQARTVPLSAHPIP